MVYPHVLHQLVMIGELLLTHRAHHGIPFHCRQLYGTCATSQALTPFGRSSPLRRDDTCCFTLLRGLLLDDHLSFSQWSGGSPPGCPTLTAWPLCATPASGPSPSASSSDERPTSPSSSVSVSVPGHH